MFARLCDFCAGGLAVCALIGLALGPPWYAVVCTLLSVGMVKAGSRERAVQRREVSDG